MNRVLGILQNHCVEKNWELRKNKKLHKIKEKWTLKIQKLEETWKYGENWE